MLAKENARVTAQNRRIFKLQATSALNQMTRHLSYLQNLLEAEDYVATASTLPEIGTWQPLNYLPQQRFLCFKDMSPIPCFTSI